MDVPMNENDADQYINFTLESVEEEADRVRQSRDEIIQERTFNKKQKVVFLMMTAKMVKRHLILPNIRGGAQCTPPLIGDRQ